jgi:hypothetical protein
MDQWKLRRFFCELINLMYLYPGRPGFGSPVSWLIEQMCVYQDKFLGRICGDYTGDSHECRLNNAGLKMYWHVERQNGDWRGFKCSIGGDQAADYPEFVIAAKGLIKQYGFNKR